MKERYLQSVRALMDCPAEERERLLLRLNNALTTYLEDVPEADETDLVANFGMPEDCAAHLMEGCAPKAVSSERRKRTRHHRILVAVLTVLLIAAIGFSTYLWSNGGLVVIRTTPARQEYWDNLPSDHIIYHYDD